MIAVGLGTALLAAGGCASSERSANEQRADGEPVGEATAELVTGGTVNLWNHNEVGQGAKINVCFAVRPRLQTDGQIACQLQSSKSVDCSGHSSHPTDGNLNPDALRAMIKEKIDHSFARYGNVEFNWMGDCPIDPASNRHRDVDLARTIVVQLEQQFGAVTPGTIACNINQVPNTCAGLGNAYCAVHPGQTQGFCQNNTGLDWTNILGPSDDGPTVIQYNWAALKLGFDWNLIHEAGHALGFQHEWYRSDFFDQAAESYFASNGACSSDAQCASAGLGGKCASSGAMAGRCVCDTLEKTQTDGLKLTTLPDPSSIMNYCHANTTNPGAQLSQRDVMGLLTAYGNKRIGPDGKRLDYFQCGLEGEACPAQGSNYVAFGADGQYTFKLVADTFVCERATFDNVDPAPGVRKGCYISPFKFVVNEGASFFPEPGKEIAFGANGSFLFKSFSSASSVKCDRETFGDDPAPNVPKKCFVAIPQYAPFASEGTLMQSLDSTALAYGAKGHYIFKVASGSLSCSNTGFGYDPVPNTPKTCYKLRAKRLADEGQAVNAPLGTVLFGSGRNGLFFTRLMSSGTCSRETFGGDPDLEQAKRCFGPLQ